MVWPKVTVLMPVHNGELFLSEAIESVLNQSYSDFEFLIIDDGSTDRSAEIIASYRDPRIRLVQNGARLELVATLIRGFELAKGEYVARMDCDDISMPKRLEIQLRFLEEHPEVGVLGCRVRIVDRDKHFISEPERPLTHTCNIWRLLFKSSVMHSSVMFRKDIIKEIGGYSPQCFRYEDYDLWSRASRRAQIRQLPNVLVWLRKHGANVSAGREEVRRPLRLSIAKSNILRYFKDEGDLHYLEAMIDYVQSGHFIQGQNGGIFSDLVALYFRFLQRTNPTYADRKWVTLDFLDMISPLLSHPFMENLMKNFIFFARIMRSQSNRKYELHQHLFLWTICATQLMRRSINVLKAL